MTIEKLLQCTADDFDKFTDKELLDYFAPFLHITRPDRAAAADAVVNASGRQKVRTGKVDPALEAIAKLQQFGIDFDKLS